MARPEVIRKRLERLEEHLGILQRLREYDEDDFLAEPERYGSAERFLQLGIETTLDMAAHVSADLELGVVNQSRDLPALFREHGYIDSSLEERWIRMIGFRNILVHDYLDVDRSVVYGILQHNLDDLRELRRVFARFL